MTMDGNQVFPGSERSSALRRQREGIVTGDVTAGLEGKYAIDVNLGVLIVIEPRLQVVVSLRRQIYSFSH